MARLTIFALIAMAFVVGSVYGKSMLRSRRGNEDECLEDLIECVTPVLMLASLSEETLREEILDQGLGFACTPLANFVECFTEIVDKCDLPLDSEQQDNLALLIKLTDFLCKENLNALNANRQCAFGNALKEATDTRCGNPETDQLSTCQLAAHIDCGADVYADVCNNPSLASKFRELSRDLKEDVDCGKILKIREVIRDLVARM